MYAGNAAELIDEVQAADYVLHDPSRPEPMRGLESVREVLASVTAAFPDARTTVEDLITEGN